MKKARLSPSRFPGLYGPESALKLGYYNQGNLYSEPELEFLTNFYSIFKKFSKKIMRTRR
jgi:hypothetical protein